MTLTLTLTLALTPTPTPTPTLTRCASRRTWPSPPYISLYLHPYLPYISYVSPYISPNQVRLASYLAISAAPPDDVRGFLPLLRAVLAGLREERMDPTQPVRVGLLSDNAARACDYCHREIFNTCVRVRHPSLDASRAARPNPLRTGPRAPASTDLTLPQPLIRTRTRP